MTWLTQPEQNHAILCTADLTKFSNKFATAIEMPVFYGTDKEKTNEYKGIYNEQSKELAQIASKHYQIIQHRDVVNAVAKALKDRNMEVQGSLKNYGNQLVSDLTFMNGKSPIKDDTKEGVRLGMRMTNSYNRSAAFRLEMFGYRMFCTNGMVLGKAMNQVREVVFHMGQEKTLAFIQETVNRFIDSVIASSNVLQHYVDQSLKDSAKWDQIGKILEKYLSHNKHREAICKKLGISVIEVYDKKTKKRSFSYVLEDDNKPQITRWDLYNAITDYATHEALGRSVENNVQEVAQKILKKPYTELMAPTTE